MKTKQGEDFVAKQFSQTAQDLYKDAVKIFTPKSHPRWVVRYTKGTTSYILDHLYKTRRLARMAAGNGKRPWYRVVRVKVIIEE